MLGEGLGRRGRRLEMAVGSSSCLSCPPLLRRRPREGLLRAVRASSPPLGRGALGRPDDLTLVSRGRRTKEGSAQCQRSNIRCSDERACDRFDLSCARAHPSLSFALSPPFPHFVPPVPHCRFGFLPVAPISISFEAMPRFSLSGDKATCWRVQSVSVSKTRSAPDATDATQADAHCSGRRTRGRRSGRA